MQEIDYLPDSDEIRKKKNSEDSENTDCIHDFCPLKHCGVQLVQQHGEMIQGEENGTRNPCVQAWMFPGRAWEKVDMGSAWTWLMEVGRGWVVLGVVKTCSDGALIVRNMRSFLVS